MGSLGMLEDESMTRKEELLTEFIMLGGRKGERQSLCHDGKQRPWDLQDRELLDGGIFTVPGHDVFGPSN